MKILILSPHIDAQHSLVQALKARGDAVLVSKQLDEGWKVLQVHGASIDLAILHREGAGDGEPGAELNSKIKKNSTFADLPVLFTTEVWNDEQCAAHQQTPVGANAYLHWPFDAKKLIETVDAIFGPGAATEFPTFDNTHAPTLSIIAPAPKMDMGGMVLEDPSQIFEKAGADLSNSGIKLSAFEGKPEATHAKIDAHLSAPAEAFKVAEPLLSTPQRSGADDVSKLLKPQADAPLDLLDIPLAEPAAASSVPAAAPAAPAFEGGLDLLAVDLPAQAIPTAPQASEPPGFEPESFDLGPGSSLSVSAMSMSDVGGPPPISSIPTTPSTPRALEPPELEDTLAKIPHVAADDAAVENELPYLFNKDPGAQGQAKNKPFQPNFSHPVGDSVVPGGAANAPDMETLKKYLLLREQDVAALSGQLKATREENAQLNHQLREEQDRAEGLDLLAEDQKKKIEEFEREKAIALETLTNEIAELRFQSKAKTDKAKLLEIQVNEASQEIERLKDRVRSDIRKIRVRERELENQLEMAKKDNEVVLGAREGKIVELKRKIDLLEFNMDLLQDRFNRERESNNKLREKLGKAAQVVRVAEGLLDDPQGTSLSSKDAAGSLTAGKSTSDKAS